MKAWIVLGLILAALPAPAIDRSADEAAIRQAMERMDEAYRQRDARALGALMAEDFENWLGTDKGREVNMAAGMEALKAQPNAQYRRSGEIGIVFLAADVALYKAYWEFSGISDDQGKLLPDMKLLGACVMVKREGHWQMAAFFSRPAGK